MSSTGVRLRSVLYVPGANERALERARTLPADALLLDLEDAVAPEAKSRARTRVCEEVAARTFASPTVAIRVNSAGTRWHAADLAEVCAAGPDAVVLAKVDGPGDVLAAVGELERLGAPERTRVWAMLETPAAVLRAGEIAGCSQRLTVLVMGTNDLLAELHAQPLPGRGALQVSLGLCLLAARATGRTILDGVHNEVADARGLEAECAQGRELGFDGKTLIHPAQIEVCNRAFTPSPGEVAYARRVIAAYEQHRPDGAGAVIVDGRMVESLHVASARRILLQAGAS